MSLVLLWSFKFSVQSVLDTLHYTTWCSPAGTGSVRVGECTVTRRFATQQRHKATSVPSLSSIISYFRCSNQLRRIPKAVTYHSCVVERCETSPFVKSLSRSALSSCSLFYMHCRLLLDLRLCTSLLGWCSILG